jgi:ribonuclease HI
MEATAPLSHAGQGGPDGLTDARGPNRRIYVAAVLALTEPGPAGAGIVVTDERGRLLAQRASYLGQARRDEAAAQALLLAMRLAAASGLKSPTFLMDDRSVVESLTDGAPWSEPAGRFAPALQQAATQLDSYTLELIPTSANQARSIALTPLVEWLPERTRRAEDLRVTPLGDYHYEVASETTPGQTYHITFRPPGEPGDGDPISCECADFLYRGLPCKHLLAVARQYGGAERLLLGRRAA